MAYIDSLQTAHKQIENQLKWMLKNRAADINKASLVGAISEVIKLIAQTGDSKLVSMAATLNELLPKPASEAEPEPNAYDVSKNMLMYISQVTALSDALNKAIEKEKKKNDKEKEWNPIIQEGIINPLKSVKGKLQAGLSMATTGVIAGGAILFVGVPLLQLAMYWTAGNALAILPGVVQSGITSVGSAVGAEAIFSTSSLFSMYGSMLKFTTTAFVYLGAPIASIWALNKLAENAKTYIIDPIATGVKSVVSTLSTFANIGLKLASFGSMVLGGLVSGVRAMFKATEVQRYVVAYRTKKHVVEPVVNNVAYPMYSTGKNAMTYAFSSCKRKPAVRVAAPATTAAPAYNPPIRPELKM